MSAPLLKPLLILLIWEFYYIAFKSKLPAARINESLLKKGNREVLKLCNRLDISVAQVAGYNFPLTFAHILTILIYSHSPFALSFFFLNLSINHIIHYVNISTFLVDGLKFLSNIKEIKKHNSIIADTHDSFENKKLLNG
jgi:hypothetical protein